MRLTDILGWSFFVLLGIWALILQPRREMRRRDEARRQWIEERKQSEGWCCGSAAALG